nr:hypothetical protein [Tanacetum cinerariifolium]
MSSSSSSSHATVTYTFVSFDTDLPSCGIPLMEAYEPEPEAPLSHVYALEYLEYLAPSDDDIAPAEDQPLPASPIALSLGYTANSKPIDDDFKEDLKIDLIDYVADEEEEEHPFEDEDREEEEEEHLALADSTLSVPDYTRLHRARISFRPHTPLSPFTKARIAEYASTPTPPSLSPSSLSLLSSPLPLIPTPPMLLPSPTCIDIILEANMPLQKRVRFTAPSHKFDIRESSAAATARQNRPALTHGIDYGF